MQFIQKICPVQGQQWNSIFYMNVKKEPMVRDALLMALVKGYIVGTGQVSAPICLPLVSHFFDHDIIDAVNISIKKRNSTFMQAQVVLEIICN